MDQAGAKTPTFLWRGILILLPVVLLAAVGLYSLRQDRELAEVEARAQCTEMAESMTVFFSSAILGRMAQIDTAHAIMALDKEGNAVSLGGIPERAAISEVPVPREFSDTVLSGPQLQAWHLAHQIEFCHGELSAEIEAWRQFIRLSPQKAFLAQARYDLGVALVRNHKIAEANDLFKKVEEDRTTTTEGGLSLWLLAEMQRAKLDPGILDSVLQDVLYHPNFGTPAIFGQLAESYPHGLAQKTWNLWQDDEATRAFYAHVREAIIDEPARHAFWTTWNGKLWLALQIPFKGSQSLLWRFEQAVVLQAIRDMQAIAPNQLNYTQLGVELAGREMLPIDTNWPVLGHASAPLWPGETNNIVIREFLAKPALLYAQQRRRTVWFAALILASAAAATAGFVSAYRGFHQQLRLSEMKSNFVSSVSHELRAPIASMRLLAESLERGKVTEDVKQKEYYRFLVQESQRLSSLIENILDFSRIEQGRKTYQFESTNLPSLVEQTVKIMQPCAEEHGVGLAVDQIHGDDFPPVQCDGLAIQQALINLIDNAIKHSPNSAMVRVGMARRAAETSIFVEDNGPGIPADEHQRIFERFYRRGSELRRETQGIGIGLSIVKHTMDAHGGRVEVRSEVGRGSRFTLVLPDAKEQ